MAIYWRVPDLLAARGINPNQLAAQTALTVPAAYRLASGEPIQRIDAATLETLCRAFKVGPADLLRFDPALPRGRDGKRGKR